MTVAVVPPQTINFVDGAFVLGLSYILAGGIGAFEGLLTILMVASGVPPHRGAAAGLLYRGYNDVLMALLGAPFAIWIHRRTRRSQVSGARRRAARRSPA